MILSNQRRRGTSYLPASWVSLHQDWIKRVIKALDGVIVKAELNEVSLEYTAISPHFSEQPDLFEPTSRHSFCIMLRYTTFYLAPTQSNLYSSIKFQNPTAPKTY